MIVAHHLGEHLLPQLVAGGAATGPALLIVMRARLSGFGRALRRRRAGHGKRSAGWAELASIDGPA
jgi:hypothetical protein